MADKLEKIQKLVGKKKVSKICKFAEDGDPAVRAAAFLAIGECGDTQEGNEALQNSIRDSEPQVRMAIAKAFQKIGNDHVSEALHHQMLQETDPALKAEFGKALDFTRGRQFGG